jgi:tetratricopeptide (TPR) repeat protein
VTDPKRFSRIDTLAANYLLLYWHGRTADYLDEIIKFMEEASSIVPPDSPFKLTLLRRHNGAIMTRYLLTGNRDDIDKGLKDLRDVVDLTPANSDKWLDCIGDLASALSTRYQNLGNLADLQESIQLCKEALDSSSCPSDGEIKTGLQRTLAAAYMEEYQRSGDTTFLERSVALDEEVVQNTDPESRFLAGRLDSLMVSYAERYKRNGALKDLDRAVQLAQEILDNNVSSQALSFADKLESLGRQLLLRYQRLLNDADIERCIEVCEEAVKTTPANHIYRADKLNCLAMAYGTRYQEKRDFEDLERSIRLGQEAAELTPTGHPNRADRLFDLQLGYRNLWQKTGDVNHLEMSIVFGRDAVKSTPLDRPDRARQLNALGISYQIKFHHLGGSHEDFHELRRLARECWQGAFDHTPSSIEERLKGGSNLFNLYAGIPDWTQAYETGKQVLASISRLTSHSLEISDKQHLLIRFADLASEAAAAALRAGKTPFDAIQLLEAGRGVIARSLNELRSDVSDLEQKYPELAREYINLRDQLDSVSTQTNENIQTTSRKYDAAQKFEKIVEAIRSQPGFEHFFMAPSEGEIQAAASYGPIVILNTSFYGCDGLIIKQDGFHHLPLEQLQVGDVFDWMEGEMADPEVLEWLWESVTQPILDYLGLNCTPEDGEDWPHIWWMPTGSLARFPIHAAGLHYQGSRDTVIDRVVSSYATSVQALLYSRRSRLTRTETTFSASVLLVGMETTPGLRSLDYAAFEIERLTQLCRVEQVPVLRPSPQKADVLSALADCNIFHFAGHGMTDSSNPLNSQLLLKDWKDQPLTVAGLLETNIRSRAPFLAYLSACGTGQIKREELMDESLHLIGAYQLAGFQHVIGTLWEVNDKSCVDVAYETYKHILRRGMSDDSVGMGLHHAVRRLRDQWMVEDAEDRVGKLSLESDVRGNSRDLSSWDEDQHIPLHWVPYVHFGL